MDEANEFIVACADLAGPTRRVNARKQPPSMR
jgi:hypothetical protein